MITNSNGTQMVRKKTTPQIMWSVEEYRQVASFFTILKEIHQKVTTTNVASSKPKKAPKKTKYSHIRTRSPAGSFFIPKNTCIFGILIYL